MRKGRFHPGQLEIDFSIPACDPLTPRQVADALWSTEKMTTTRVYELIQEGKFGAIRINRIDADRETYRIPLHNFIAYLNGKYGDALYFRFPEADQLSVGRVAKALRCSDQHVINLIGDEEFPGAINVGRRGKRKHWQIPIRDLVAYVNRNRVGAYL